MCVFFFQIKNHAHTNRFNWYWNGKGSARDTILLLFFCSSALNKCTECSLNNKYNSYTHFEGDEWNTRRFMYACNVYVYHYLRLVCENRYVIAAVTTLRFSTTTTFKNCSLNHFHFAIHPTLNSKRQQIVLFNWDGFVNDNLLEQTRLPHISRG